jgi:hypothetical protein
LECIGQNRQRRELAGVVQLPRHRDYGVGLPLRREGDRV